MSEYCKGVLRAMADERLPSIPLCRMQAEGFADGEMEVSLIDSVRGKDVFIIASSAMNPDKIPPAECKLELYHALDALKRAKAGRLTVFEPYVACSRSDRATRRNSVGLWVHFKIVVSLGADQIVTFQLHSDKSKSMLDPVTCRFDDIPAYTLLAKDICDRHIRNRQALIEEVRPGWAFCSVDSGGEKLAKRFASIFGCELVIAHKQRDYCQPNRVERIDILSSGDLRGKKAWIVDDMVDTAASAEALIRELGKRGLSGINLAAVHPVLSGPAVSRLLALHQEGLLGELLVMDTVPGVRALVPALPFLRIVDSTGLAAAIVRTLHVEGSMSGFFEEFCPQAYLEGR